MTNINFTAGSFLFRLLVPQWANVISPKFSSHQCRALLPLLLAMGMMFGLVSESSAQLVLPVVPDKTYTVDTPITDTLPAEASGTSLSYTLTGPNGMNLNEVPGLVFDAGSRTLSGTPTVLGVTMLTYTATPSRGLAGGGGDGSATPEPATRRFTVTVRPSGLSQENIQQLNEAIMSRLSQSMIASTVASVEQRIDIAFSGTAQTASYQFDGQSIQLDDPSTLADRLEGGLLRKLTGYADSMKNGSMNWKHALGNSSFSLPLNATDGGDGANPAIWGSGSYSKLNGDGKVDWDGDVVSVQLGVDNRVRDDVLVGGMVSWSEGDVDYTLNGDSGNYNHKVTSVHPYLAWSNADINLWGSVGYGQGELEIKETNRTTETDTNLLSLAAGIEGQLPKPGMSLKSDILLVRTDIDARGNIITEQRIDSQQLRLLLEIGQERRSASGGVFKPIMEWGLRYDGGDGDTGVGVLLGAGLRYANASGFTVQGKVHALIGRDDYNEWGFQGLISLDPGTDQLGLAFSLRPGYGYSEGNHQTSAMWHDQPQKNLPGANRSPDYRMQMDATLSYGLSAPGGRGLLMPYSEATLGDVDRYRLGLRWKRNSRLDLNLFGEEQEGEHTVLLESRIRF